MKKLDIENGAKEIWSQYNKLTKGKSSYVKAPAGVTATALNNHYAAVSSDKSYRPTHPKLTCTTEINSFVTERDVFNLMDKLRPTATGLDLIPAWFLRLVAPVFAAPISQLFNQSIIQAVVPVQWKKAFICPIPKVTHPESPVDFRPISITPVLSRIMEKLVVRNYIYPALLTPPQTLTFQDQFAFRPTGSTTAALIAFYHHICEMLSTNSYVRVIALDFSKAFDTVRHATLFEKLARLDIPDEVYNWIRDFFQARSQSTKFSGDESDFAELLASIFQGSGVGPACYVITAGDLQTLNVKNKLLKYADDTYLIIPAETTLTVADEIRHIEDWSKENNLNLNRAKSREIIFTRTRARCHQVIYPPVIVDIPRVEKLTVLGVVVNAKLTVSDHVTEVIHSCSRNLYALKMLQTHGLTGQSLHHVFTAAIQSKLLYCSPAWSGFTTAADRRRLDVFIRRSKRYGYCSPDALPVSELFDNADNALFRAIINNSSHILGHFLSIKSRNNYNARHRKHNFELIKKTTSLGDRNFLIRMLYKDIY